MGALAVTGQIESDHAFNGAAPARFGEHRFSQRLPRVCIAGQTMHGQDVGTAAPALGIFKNGDRDLGGPAAQRNGETDLRSSGSRGHHHGANQKRQDNEAYQIQLQLFHQTFSYCDLDFVEQAPFAPIYIKPPAGEGLQAGGGFILLFFVFALTAMIIPIRLLGQSFFL